MWYHIYSTPSKPNLYVRFMENLNLQNKTNSNAVKLPFALYAFSQLYNSIIKVGVIK